MNQSILTRRLATCGVIALAALLVAACASLAPEPGDSTTLAGRWSLDAGASGDFDAAVAGMLAEHQKKVRGNRRRHDVGADGSDFTPGAEDAPGFPPVPDEAPERVRERLGEALRPPTGLLVELGPGTVSLRSDDEPARLFYPGQRVGRIDTGGTARLDAGWSGPVFVVEQKYSSGATRVQRYAAQGGELVVTLAYSDPFSGSFNLRSVYRRR